MVVHALRHAAFPWLSGPRAPLWRLAARLAYLALLAAGMMLGDMSSAWKLLAALVLSCAVLGKTAAEGKLRPVRIWLGGLLFTPWLVIAVGNAALGERVVALAYGQGGLASLLAGDVLVVLVCWPVIFAAAVRIERS